MSLAAKSLSAVKSNYVGTIIRVGAQFIAQILIMRQLGPELIGTFGYEIAKTSNMPRNDTSIILEKTTAISCLSLKCPCIKDHPKPWSMINANTP